MYEDYEIQNIFYDWIKQRNRIVLKHKVTNEIRDMTYARYLMEVELNRELTRNEIVHHIDDNTLNDEPSNRQVVTIAEHNKIHKQKHFGRQCICATCGKQFYMTASQVRNQNKVFNRGYNKSQLTYCSTSCASSVKRPRVKYNDDTK